MHSQFRSVGTRKSGNPSLEEFKVFREKQAIAGFGIICKLIKSYVWTPCLRVGVTEAMFCNSLLRVGVTETVLCDSLFRGVGTRRKTRDLCHS